MIMHTILKFGIVKDFSAIRFHTTDTHICCIYLIRAIWEVVDLGLWEAEESLQKIAVHIYCMQYNGGASVLASDQIKILTTIDQILKAL